MRKFLLPLLFIVLFIFESLVVQFIPPDVFGQERILVPRFLFAALLFLTIFVGMKKGMIYAAIFGLLFDIVYVEVLGIYLFLFPFICYLISKIMNAMQANIAVAFLVSLFGITILEICVYEMDHLIHITSMGFMTFVNLRLWPTLLLNAIFLLIAGYPLKMLFEKYAGSLREE